MRLLRLLVYCVSVVICLVGLVDTLQAQRGVGPTLFTLFFLTSTLGLFGAITYEIQEGQREWQQDRETNADCETQAGTARTVTICSRSGNEDE